MMTKLSLLTALIMASPSAFAQVPDIYSVHESYATRQQISEGNPRAIVAGERMRERYYDDLRDNSSALYPSHETPREPVEEDTFND
jgi:hypothetical protein